MLPLFWNDGVKMQPNADGQRAPAAGQGCRKVAPWPAWVAAVPGRAWTGRAPTQKQS